MIRNLSKEEYESEKRRILSLIYNPYTSNNSDGDEYVAGQQVSTDKIQNRVDFQMYKNRIYNGSKIQEDVYQMVFEQLLKLNEKNTKIFVDKYYKNPDSAYHFAFYLLKIKGFTVHPQAPERPSHSLAKSIVYASSFNSVNVQMDIVYEDIDAPEDGWDVTPFERKYDISVEEIISQLTEEERELFYSMIDKKKKGLKKKEMQLKIAELHEKIKWIKDNNDNSNKRFDTGLNDNLSIDKTNSKEEDSDGVTSSIPSNE